MRAARSGFEMDLMSRRFAGAIGVAILLADQATKAWIADLILDPPRQIILTGFLNLTPVWNRGVSFGLFASDDPIGPWVLAGLATAVSVGLAAWLARSPRGMARPALALVIGGALGNVVDRLRFGAVFDFVDVHAAGWHWPAFNLADSAITIGVALLLFDGLFQPSTPRKEPT
jgi:signal peptidase II